MAVVPRTPASARTKHDRDYVFYELTRSICPECRTVIDAHIVLRDNKVFMRKRCPEHGQFEALVYGDAQAYTSAAKFNKPGTLPLEFSTAIRYGCPHDCGLCPDHQQHTCLGIIEVNSACNMDCPLCFAQPHPWRGRRHPGPSRRDRGRPGNRAVLRRRAFDPSPDHRHDAGSQGARHPPRHAQYQRQAHSR